MNFDLSAAWANDPRGTAHILADTMRCAMTGSDREPIREHYRQANDAALRGAIAAIMTEAPQ